MTPRAEAALLWQRHCALRLPMDVREDRSLIEVNDSLGQVTETFLVDGHLSAPDQQWLRSVRPELHHRLVHERPSDERGYIESLITVVDALLGANRLA